MGLAFFRFLPVLDSKVNGETKCSQYDYAEHHIESFHSCYSSLSFGVKKYAATVSMEVVSPIVIANGRVNFSANMLPIIPTVSVYLAASAKILATTLRLSLFIKKLYHKKEA